LGIFCFCYRSWRSIMVCDKLRGYY